MWDQDTPFNMSLKTLERINDLLIDCSNYCVNNNIIAYKRNNYLKLMFWDRTGYCLICKKLERGSFSLPDGELDLEKLKLIFDGIKLGRKARK